MASLGSMLPALRLERRHYPPVNLARVDLAFNSFGSTFLPTGEVYASIEEAAERRQSALFLLESQVLKIAPET